jgi:hypothetical protein
MEQHFLAYAVGIFIVFSSHTYMLYAPNKPLSTIEQHCYVNILASFLIAYYFMFKEGYINY